MRLDGGVEEAQSKKRQSKKNKHTRSRGLHRDAQLETAETVVDTGNGPPDRVTAARTRRSPA
jgi:hypothetical protein